MIPRDPSPSLPLFDAPKPNQADALFDAGHPGIYPLFRELAAKVRRQGFVRYSADSLLHQMRWHHHVEKGNREFVVNDHWGAVLARRLIRDDPTYSTFFELRKSKHDAQSA